MAKRLTVVHYVNQFFGQIGGEDKAGVGPSVLDGPVGPGRLLQQLLGDQGEVAATVICGDNYFNENIDKASEEVLVLIKPYRPDLVIAGPAFNAGRYGTACGQVCKTVQAGLGIPAVTGMFPENPGADLYRRDVFVVQTADSALGMAEAMKRALDLGRRIVGGAQIGSPSEEGYLPRGLKKNINADLNAAERAVSMLLAKIKNQPFETEISPPAFDRVAPPPPVADISSATIAFVTDGGLIRKGNPDRMPAGGATRWGGLAIEGMDDLKPDDFEALHGGYDCRPVNDDPDRLVPVDVARDLEREGAIGRLLNLVYSTAGLAATMDNSRRTGGAIAQELLRLRVDGVILTST